MRRRLRSAAKEDHSVRHEQVWFGKQGGEGFHDGTDEGSVLGKGLGGDQDQAGVVASGGLVGGVERCEVFDIGGDQSRPPAAAAARICSSDNPRSAWSVTTAATSWPRSPKRWAMTEVNISSSSRGQAQAVEACASTSSVNSSEGFFQL